MAKETNAVDTEKYAGPGRISSALGTSVLWAIPAAAVAGVGTILGFAKGATWALAGVVISGAMTVYGAVSGWRKVGKAEAQFNELKSERDVARVRAEAAEGSLQKVSDAMQHTQERFSQINRMVKERETGGAGSHPKSHAEKHESRGEHGSHAAAALADKAQAEHAERTH